MSKFHTLTIKEIIKETADAVSIVFDIPKNLHSDFKFVSGQYITLKKEINNTELRRAYSICSTPKSGQLKVAIKAVKDGAFSAYATTQLKAGDTIEISTPEGRFLLNPKENKNYLAFAAGSGITPVLSMVKTVLETEPSSSFTLIYGNKSAADTIFKKELDGLAAKFSNFNLHYVFSREKQEDTLFGRIDKPYTNFYVKNKYKDTSFYETFLCGPEEMIHIVSDTLKENGFASENIHFELFTVSIEKENLNQIKEGFTEVTFLIDEEETTLQMKQSDTILAAALRHDLDAPYSCQGGVCSSCLAKVTQGKAVMAKNAILTDAELADGFILTCQAHPTSEKITIDFDDV
jgi:ring-1,2-phenylacetyl-CoA epoxidase subunit PaaE